MLCVRSCAVATLRALLEGLGIPSDFSMSFDGVSIGATDFSQNETLLPVGLRQSHPELGSLFTRMVACPSQGPSKTGAATKNVVLESLQHAPNGGVSRRRLQASLVTVGGGGAVTLGGEDHRHKSTKAAELLYMEVFPECASLESALTWWDLFHRQDIGGKWAVKDAPMVLELLDVNNILYQLFGVGAGRVLARGVANYLEEKGPLLRHGVTASTRPMAYSHRVCAALIRNFHIPSGYRSATGANPRIHRR